MSVLRRQLLFAIAFPILLVLAAAIVSYRIALFKILEKEQDLAISVYEDQVMFEKQINAASVIQIYFKVQQIPWQQFIMNQLLYKMLLEKVEMNKRFVPILMNAEKTYQNQENSILTSIALKNKLHVSSWYNPDSQILNELSSKSIKNLKTAAALDFFSRPVRYLSSLQTENSLSQNIDLFKFLFAFDSDGSMLTSFINTTSSVLPNQIDCPDHQNNYDFRCRIWYQYVKASPISIIFPPAFTLGETNKEFFVASVICKKQIDFFKVLSNPNATLFAHCIELQLSNLKTFFSGYSNEYSRQMVIDPISQNMVFDTDGTFNTLEVLTLKQQLLSNLTNETSQILSQFLVKNFGSYIVSQGDSVNIPSKQKGSQYSIEFENNQGKKYYMIANSISFIDKIKFPSSQNYASKKISYEIQAFVLLDILSKEKLMEVTFALEDQINKLILVTQLTFAWIIVVCTIFVLIVSKNISSNIEVPIDSLIKIFQQMNHDPNSAEEMAQLSFDTDQPLKSISVIKELFQSKDAFILYETFSNLVQLLNFTAQDIFKGNPSQILLNLNEQILFFSRFDNASSLGICHNNIANIHYFQGRHIQALQHYEQSIIQSKIQLGFFCEVCEEKNDCNSQSKQINTKDISLIHEIQKIKKNINIPFRSTVIKSFQEDYNKSQNQSDEDQSIELHEIENVGSYEFEDSNQKKQNLSIIIDQESQFEQKQVLFENLFNRKFNYFKCLFEYYLFQNKELLCPFWEEFLILCKELINLNSLLDHSLGRSIILINFLTQIQISLNLDNESQESYTTLKQLLLLKKKEEDDLQFEKQCSNLGKQFQSNIDYTSFQPKNILQSNQILSINQINLSLSSNINIKVYFIIIQDIDSQRSQDASNLSPRKVSKKKNNYQKKIKETSLKQNIFPLKIKLSKVMKLNDINLNQQNFIFILQQSNVAVENLISPSKNNFDQSEKSLLDTNGQSDQFLSPNNLNKRQNKKNIEQKLFKCNFSFSFNSAMNQMNSQKKNVDSFEGICNQKHKISISNPKTRLEKSLIPSKGSNKCKGCYEFPSDALSSYQAICSSQYYEKKQQYYSAALVLTKNLENQFYFFQSARDIIIKKIKRIFTKFDIQEPNIKKEISILNNEQVYKLSFISLCVESQYKRQSIELAYKILDDIIKRDDDQFGVLGFDFEEMKNCSLITMSNCKMIKDNQTQIFSQIKSSFLKGYSDYNKEAEDKTEMNNTFDLFPHLKKEETQNQVHNIESEMPEGNFTKFIEDQSNNVLKGTSILFFNEPPQKQTTKNCHGNNVNSRILEASKVESKSKILQFQEPDFFCRQKLNISKDKYTTIFHHSIRYSILNWFFGGSLTREQMTKNYILSKKKGIEKKNLKKILVKNSYFSNSRKKEKKCTLIFQDEPQAAIPLEKKISSFGEKGKIAQTWLQIPVEKMINKSEKMNQIKNQEQNESLNISRNKNTKLNSKIVVKKYLILYLDSEFLINLSLYQLGKYLYDHDIKMLVLILAPNLNQEGNSQLQDFLIEGNEIIQYFFSEDKLMQYLNNQRQHNKYKHVIQTVERF